MNNMEKPMNTMDNLMKFMEHRTTMKTIEKSMNIMGKIDEHFRNRLNR